MRRPQHFLAASLATLGLLASPLALAADQADFKKALARAEEASKQAIAMKNQWTPSTAALADAKKAADAGDVDKALALAERSEALSKAAIAQSRAEEQAWREAVIK